MSRAKFFSICICIVIVIPLIYLIFPANIRGQQPDPHGTESVNTRFCETCHDIHEAPNPRWQRQDKVHLLVDQDEKAVCYTCHNGTAVPPSLDVQKEFGDNLDGTSSKASHHPVPEGSLVCSDCHTSHMEKENWLLPNGLAEVVRLLRVRMGNVWGYLINQLNLTWLETPVRQRIANPSEYCGGCHGPGSSLPGGDLITNYLGTSHETGLVAPAPPLSPIKCNVCHLWHGSDLAALLQPQVNGVNITGNNNSLCFACHSLPLGAYGGQNLFGQTKHATVATSSAASPIWPGSFYQAGYCLNCHDPHGTASTDYHRADKNNLCTACHDASGVTLPPTYSYRGKDRYGFSAHGEDISPYNIWPVPTETGFAVGSGGATAGECINCHNPMGKDSGIGVPYAKLLLRWDVNNNSGEENLCYGGSGISGGCHTATFTYTDFFYGMGTRSSNIYNSFNPALVVTATAPSGARVNQHHDISQSDQVTFNTGAKIECDNCHNPHLNNKAYDFANASRIANPDSLTANWVAKYQANNIFNYNGAPFNFAGTDLDPSFGAPLPDFDNYCLACHDNTLPPGVSFGAFPTTNIALYYAGTLGVIDEHGRGDGHGGLQGTLKYPYFGALVGDSGEPTAAYAAMNCTDCHDSHGSGGLYSLKTGIIINGVALTTAGGASSFAVTDNTFGGEQGWCSFCHTISPGHATIFGPNCGGCHYHGSSIF